MKLINFELMNSERQVGKINKYEEMLMIKHMKNSENPSVLDKKYK